jgi:CheY-like chemotaxis protein/AraC-like DNA-binding protein
MIQGCRVSNKTRPTVLVVDDEQGILEAVGYELEDDFAVITAAGGPEALDLLARRHVDAMLLDLRMPEMAGEEVLKRLRALRARLPVVVMTVVSETKTVVECMKLGAADYLNKPWENGEAAARIQRVLREVDAVPGVLLVSDDPAALVPLQLALEHHGRAATMSVADASASDFPAQLVVLHAPDRASMMPLSRLPERFRGAAVLWVSDDPAVGGPSLLPKRLDVMLDYISKLLGSHAVPRRSPSRVVIGAVDLMVGHCRDPLTIEAIATRVGVSEDHLSRMFREVFGLPAASYYTRLRIAVAGRLLRDTDDKMDDVARQVGYSGAANLSRAFSGVMGVRPGEFRRSPP